MAASSVRNGDSSSVYVRQHVRLAFMRKTKCDGRGAEHGKRGSVRSEGGFCNVGKNDSQSTSGRIPERLVPWALRRDAAAAAAVTFCLCLLHWNNTAHRFPDRVVGILYRWSSIEPSKAGVTSSELD